MTLSSLTYAPPVRRGARPQPRDFAILDEAVELTEQGQHLESLAKVLAHLFPDAAPRLEQRPFTFVQGSSQVTAKLEGDELFVSVPLVKLPAGGGAIAALRYVLTKLSANGQLHQPRLRGDDVYLEFRDKISRLHPAKLLELLRRMPTHADNNDDWLIGQFGAQPLERAPLGELDADELARSQQIWHTHWDEIDALLKEAQRKRSLFFLNEVTAYAVYRLQFALPLSGFLAAKLGEAAYVFNDTEEDPNKRETTLTKFIKEMKAVTADQLKADLGHATYAISPLADGEAAQIREYFAGGDYIDTIDKYRKTDKAADAALALVSTFTFLLARYAWPEEVAADFEAALAAAAGKPWREAADVLFHAAKEIVGKLPDDEDEEGEGDEEGSDEDEGEDEGGAS